MEGHLISLVGESEEAGGLGYQLSLSPGPLGRVFCRSPLPLGDRSAGSGERELKPPKASKTCCFLADCSEKATWGNQNAQQQDCC